MLENDGPVEEVKVADTPSEGQESDGQTSAENASDPYKDKSPDELRSMLRDAQKQIGKQANEVGEVRRLKEEFEALRSELAQRQYQQFEQPRYVPAPPKEEEEEFDFTSVPKSVEKIVERKLQQERQARQMEMARRDALDAQAAFEAGKKEAFKQNPELYRGLEKDLEWQFFNGWKNGTVDKRTLADPSNWEALAVVMRHQKGDLANVMSRKTVTAPRMETPTSRRMAEAEDDDTFQLTREDRDLMERSGLSEKEYREAYGIGLAMKRNGSAKYL